jgi:hypothetical protein
VFELCEPEPLAVATWIEKSLTSGGACGEALARVDALGKAVMELPGEWIRSPRVITPAAPHHSTPP